MPDDFPPMKNGTQIEPYHFNIIYAELRRWRKARFVGRNVSATGVESSTSPPVITVLQSRRGKPAVATSDVTCRSGSTPGNGSVQLVHLSNGSIANLGNSFTAYTVSSTNAANSANSIVSGKYCWVEWDDDGTPWVGPLEC